MSSMVADPTPPMLNHVRAMGDAANLVSLTAVGQSQMIEGTICIAASEIYAAFVLPPILAKLRLAQPQLHVEVIASTRSSDLRRRQADIAIRNFRPTEPVLIAKKIRDVPARLYATPGYLESIGKPKFGSGLSQADFISTDNSGEFLKRLNALGLDLTERNFPVFVENYLVMWEMVKHGLGIGILDGHVGDAEALVQRVLPDMKPLVFPIWLVAHR